MHGFNFKFVFLEALFKFTSGSQSFYCNYEDLLVVNHAVYLLFISFKQIIQQPMKK